MWQKIIKTTSKLIKQEEKAFERIASSSVLYAKQWEALKPLIELKSYAKNRLSIEHSNKIKEGINKLVEDNREKEGGAQSKNSEEKES